MTTFSITTSAKKWYPLIKKLHLFIRNKEFACQLSREAQVHKNQYTSAPLRSCGAFFYNRNSKGFFYYRKKSWRIFLRLQLQKIVTVKILIRIFHLYTLFYNIIFNNIAFHICLGIFHCRITDCIKSFLRQECLMWCDNNIRKR